MRNKLVISCSALAVLLSPLGWAATQVSPADAVATRTVNFADLDLTNSRAVATLYRRIRTAAGEVCYSDEPTSLQTFRYVRSCTREAIDRAVKDVDSAGLTTFHVAVTSRRDAG